MSDIEKVITIALNEEGYLEKNNKNNLDNKTINAGSNNYTKYWADMAPSYQGQPWCACFVNWCFKHAYGETEAKNLLCTKGAWSYYTPTSAQYFKNMHQWFTTPQRGDVIFFKNSQRICHTGIVLEVKNGRVYTIEGNTSGGSTLEANGGCVAKKNYPLGYNRIAGYGRPKYSNTPAAVPSNTSDYYPKYTGTSNSISDALKSLGIDNSKANRTAIASKNGIPNYKGTSAQNIQLLTLLKQGKLLK